MFAKGKDRKEYAGLTWMCLIFLGWLISNLSDYINEAFAVRTYFLLVAVAITIIATRYRKNGFFQFAFWELSIYNVFDEVLNMGDSSQWYELPIVFMVLIIAYYKFKK